MKKTFIFLLSILMIFIFEATPVLAEEIKKVDIYSLNEGSIGRIAIHDDYVVEITYKYAVADVNIVICSPTNCDFDKQHKVFNETYFDDDKVEFYLNEYFTFTNESHYQIEVFAKFKHKQGTTTEPWTDGSVETEFTYILENAADKPGEDPGHGSDFRDSATGAGEKIRDIAIPVIYGILAVVLVVKGVLLGMDITRYADQPDVRKEKIKAFAYWGGSILILAGFNTLLGFVTGLFG